MKPNEFADWAGAFLGLVAPSTVDPVSTLIRPPRHAVGQAFAADATESSPRRPAMSRLERIERGSKRVVWVDIWPASPSLTEVFHRIGVAVRIAADDDAVVLVEARDAATVWEGECREVDGGVLVDVHAGPAVVRVVGRSGELLLRITTDAVWAGSVRRHVAIPGVDRTHVPLPETPVETWLSGVELRPWLVEAAIERGRSPALFDRLAAAGLVARLWALAQSRPRRFDPTRLSGSDPVERVVAWARDLSAPVLDAAERASLDRTARLRESLDQLASDRATRVDARLVRLRGLAHDRDDLASVECILRCRNRHEILAASLDALDGHAEALGADLPASLDEEDEHLAAASVIQPDTWWAGP